MIWKCKDKNIEYGSKILVMGIVNVTPDSFSDGGKWYGADNAVNHALQLVDDGADILDFGAQSTRPGYTEISPEEEWSRLERVLSRVREKIDIPISVDTYFPQVAQKAIDAGADIINDVSGVFNEDMAQIVKDTGCGWVIMHNGSGGCKEVKTFFEDITEKCRRFSIESNQLCLDMGIGFGKDYEQNLELIANIPDYKIQGYPLLLGTSRKSVIGLTLDLPATDRVEGTLVTTVFGVLKGCAFVRVHDIKENVRAIKMAEAIMRA